MQASLDGVGTGFLALSTLLLLLLVLGLLLLLVVRLALLVAVGIRRLLLGRLLLARSLGSRLGRDLVALLRDRLGLLRRVNVLLSALSHFAVIKRAGPTTHLGLLSGLLLLVHARGVLGVGRSAGVALGLLGVLLRVGLLERRGQTSSAVLVLLVVGLLRVLLRVGVAVSVHSLAAVDNPGALVLAFGLGLYISRDRA